MKDLNYDCILVGCHPFSIVASAYFCSAYSGSSTRSMRNYIRKHPAFLEDMLEAGYSEHDNMLTPMQITVIIRYMGMPGEAKNSHGQANIF